MKKVLVSLIIISSIIAVLNFCGFGCSKSNKPNVILVMIDTLRADHLGAYGYPRATSPFMDQFAKENVLAKRAISVAPWTPPAVASILTGLSVLNHKHSPNLMETHAKKLGQQLPDEIETLAEILKSAGYKTGASSSNPWISPVFNFNQGFDHFFFKKNSSTEITVKGAEEVVEQLRAESSDPFFLYMHILDPHGPRTPSAEYAAMFTDKLEGRWPYSPEMQEDINLYDAEIRSVDDQLRSFFEGIKANNLYENTVVVIVSDHGEQFDEHGQKGHGKNLHIEELHVPFIVKCPKLASVEISETVSNADVTPTILDCAGISGEWKLDGISLFNKVKLAERSGVFSSVKRAFIEEAYSSKDGMRIINSKGRAANPSVDWALKGLYDLNKDPFEANSIQDDGLQSEFNSYLNSTKDSLTRDTNITAKTKELAKDSLEQIESLGYIND